METYVVKAKEAVLAPKPQNPGNTVVRIGVILLLGSIGIYSAVTKDNVFLRMSDAYKIFLIFCFLWAILAASFRKEMIESDIEIRFGEDYLELYRPQRTYSNGKIRKTLTRFTFDDITSITYDQKSSRMIIQGKLTETQWLFKDGNCPDKATSVQEIPDGFDVIDTSKDKETDFVGTFREHAPVKVKINREIDLGFNRAMGLKKGKQRVD